MLARSIGVNIKRHRGIPPTTHMTRNEIIALFNPTCTSTLNIPNGVFDGCNDTYEGKYDGYVFRSKWKGVNDRYSSITSPSGELVAVCDTCCNNALWYTLDGCPDWLYPIGCESRDAEAQALADLRKKAQEDKEIQDLYTRLDYHKSRYHGTRLKKYLTKVAPDLVHLI